MDLTGFNKAELDKLLSEALKDTASEDDFDIEQALNEPLVSQLHALAIDSQACFINQSNIMIYGNSAYIINEKMLKNLWKGHNAAIGSHVNKAYIKLI